MGGVRASNVANGLPGDTWLAQHIAFLVQRTQLPHVDIDINTDTEVTLRIPYSSALDYYPLSALADVNRYGCQGVIKIFPYSSLESSSGLTTCGYTLWGHFEDVEMVGAAVAQSGVSSSRKSKSFSSVEQKSQNIGPITSAALKVSKASSYLYPIPFVGDYARGVTWISDIVKNVASVFGWAKPSNLAPAMRIRDELGLYASNYDAADNSLPLSMSLKAEVAHDDMASFSKFDELDIVNFVSTPAYLRTIRWFDANTSGFLLDSWEASPITDTRTDTINGRTTFSFTPCQYIAQNFGFWRGSMVYKFKLVKTDFHSGRIAVCFSPQDQRTTFPALTYNNSDFVYREIIDIRESNEFTIVIPYISSRPYKCSNGFDISYGRVYVYVVDDLVAPDTVPSAISILIEHSMTDDAEFFMPQWRPAIPQLAVIEAQMGDEEPNALVTTVIGGLSNPKFQLTTSQYSVGERILNLRTFLKRFCSNENISTTVTTQVGVYHNFLPFAWPAYNILPEEPIDIAGDFYAQMSMIFNYSRGGVRLKFVNSDTSAYGITTVLEPLNLNGDVVDSPHVASANTNNNRDFPAMYAAGRHSYAVTHPSNSAVTEIEVPMYSTTRMRANADHVSSTLVPYNVATGSLGTMISVFCTQTQPSTSIPREAISGSFLRAGGDDADFGGFISIPPLCLF